MAFALGLLASGCGSDGADAYGHNPDGSFGYPGDPSHDAGVDGSVGWRDSGASSAPTARVRFVHAIPNLGALVVCYDPDGPGPMSADVLRDATEMLRADFGARSNAVLVPSLSSGELTLQRELSRPGPGDAGPDVDAGSDPFGDGGVPLEQCDVGLREATIPLPITGAWLAPSAPVSTDQLAALDLSTSLSGVDALTLLGSGVALNQAELDRRAQAARTAWLGRDAGATAAQADRVAALERDTLSAAFGPRALIQPNRPVSSPDSFTLSVFHAIPDVTPSDPSLVGRSVGAVRLCVTAASRDTGVLPKPPAAGVPFRVRTLVGNAFVPGLSYDFRVFAQGSFDDKQQDCSTTSLMPLATASFSSFAAGQAYTLALVGAVAPITVCSANDVALARASCTRPASELGARIELLAD